MNAVAETVAPAEASDVVNDLVETLEASGYGEFTDTFLPRSGWTIELPMHCSYLSPELRTIVDLFLLSKSVATDSLPTGIGDLVPSLLDLGILSQKGATHVSMPDLTFYHTLGLWLFLQKETSNPAAYFGDDTVGLACRLRPKSGGTSLDFCAGPGTQALISARTAKHVTAVETNPVAASLARFNVIANGFENVDVLWGDLSEVRFPNRFDHISANPPLLPVPSELDFPFVGDGGQDGLTVTAKIIERLPELLAPGGRAQIIGSGLCTDTELCFGDSLSTLAISCRVDIIVTVIGRVAVTPGSPYFLGLAHTVNLAAGTDAAFAAKSYEALIDRAGATHLCSYALYIRHGTGRLTINDVSRSNRLGLWQAW